MNLQSLSDALEANLGNRLTPELAIGIVHACSQTIPNRIDLDKFSAIEHAGYKIQCEFLEHALEEVKPLHLDQWKETEGYRHSVAMSPDYEHMVHAERDGRFILFTVRSDSAVVGNCMMYLAQSTHTRRLVAEEDTIFVRPDHRKGRLGIKLIQYAESVLASLGVTEIRATVKTVNRTGDLLEALGYTHTANKFTKVLGDTHVQ